MEAAPRALFPGDCVASPHAGAPDGDGILPGSELAPEVLAAAPAGRRMVVVGGDEAVHDHLARTYPKLAWTFLQPSMGYIKRREERRRLVRATMQAVPDCVFVCTGAPQSELLAAQLKRAGCPGAILCCGSAFRFLSGAQRRAPGVVRLAGAEWLWRFAREPHTRMRYLADAVFLALRFRVFIALRQGRAGAFESFVLRTS